MNIVFATDKNYLQHLAVALVSLMERNSGMNIYIINNGIRPEDWKKLQKIFEGKNSSLIDAKIDDQDVKKLVSNAYFTMAAYYRLFTPDIVLGNKALYLDTDIVVNGCIENLYETDISCIPLAAVNNPGIYHRHELGMEHSTKYFNSGVMLINLEYWRAYNIKEKVIEFVNQNPRVIRFVDQDGLNSVINGKWLELHPKYNMQTVFVYPEHASDLLIREAVISPVIIHYAGASKPWQFINNHPYKYLYWKYLRMTPYKYALPSKPSNIIKMMLPRPIKERIKKILKLKN